jgi:hypothetical protein
VSRRLAWRFTQFSFKILKTGLFVADESIIRIHRSAGPLKNPDVLNYEKITDVLGKIIGVCGMDFLISDGSERFLIKVGTVRFGILKNRGSVRKTSKVLY